MKKIYLIFLILLTSCETLSKPFDDQHIVLNAKTEAVIAKIGNGTKIKVSVVSEVDSGNVIGHRIQPNINGDMQGKVFIKNDPKEVIKQQIEEQLKLGGFSLSENRYDKKLDSKLIYLNYRTKGGGLNPTIVCRIALKLNLSDQRGKNIYSQWYFVNDDFGIEGRGDSEITTNNINSAVNELISKMLSDGELIKNLTRK